MKETQLLDIETGSSIMYNGNSLLIKKIIEYDWGNSQISYDYILDNGKDIAYLSVEQNDYKLLLSIKYDIAVGEIDLTLPEYIAKNETPPKTIIYNNIEFQYDRESFGKSRLEDSTDWIALDVWEYIDLKSANVLTIEQYTNKEIFTSIGVVISIDDIKITE